MLQEIQAYFCTFMRSEGVLATVARNSAGSLLVKVAGVGLTFISHLLCARLMGVESYGVYIIALAWMNIFLLVGRFGFDVSSVRFVAVYFGQGNWELLSGFLRFSRSVVLSGEVLAACLLMIAIWFFRSHVSRELLHTFWLASTILPFFGLLQIREASLRGLKRVVLSLIPSAILHPLILIALLVVTAFVFNIQPRAPTVMSIYFIATFIAFGTIIYLFGSSLPGQVKNARPSSLRKKWFLASCAMMLVTSFSMVLNQTSIIMIGLFEGGAEAGLFGAATRISNLLLLSIVSVNAALAPYVADLFAKGETEQLQRVVRLCVRTVFLANVLGSLFIILSGKWILGLLGSEFVSAYNLLVILVLGQIFYAAIFPASIVLNMTGYERDSAKILGLSIVVNVALSSVLIPTLGTLGAALSTVLITCLWGGAMAIVTYKRTNISIIHSVRM